MIVAGVVLGSGLHRAASAPAQERGSREPKLVRVLPRDRIRSIDTPTFVPAARAGLPAHEPVIGLSIGTDARAYALSLLDGHEIVNDVVGGAPVAVTW